jgi:hypothetical protein
MMETPGIWIEKKLWGHSWIHCPVKAQLKLLNSSNENTRMSLRLYVYFYLELNKAMFQKTRQLPAPAD